MVGVGGGPLGTPNVVSDNVNECLGFVDKAKGKEASPDSLGTNKIGGLAVREATVGRVGSDMFLHVPGEAVPDPQEIPFSVDGVGHVHFDGARRDVVIVAAEPVNRVGRADAKLVQVQYCGGHSTSNIVPTRERSL